MKNEVQAISLDTGDPTLHAVADPLLKALVTKYGDVRALGVLIVALTKEFLELLHNDTTDPENNISAIHQLIEGLKMNVRAHEACARAHGSNPNQQTVPPIMH